MSLTNEVKGITKTDIENALVQTAYAYYKRGPYIQYENLLKNYNITPEDVTSQNVSYTECSGFTYLTYKNALNMDIPLMYKDSVVNGTIQERNVNLTSFLVAYARDLKAYATKNNVNPENFGVKFYQDNFPNYKLKNVAINDENNASARASLRKTLNDKIRPGDLIIWSNGSSGHVLMATQRYTYNNIDTWEFLNATSTRIFQTTKNYKNNDRTGTRQNSIYNGISYNNTLNKYAKAGKHLKLNGENWTNFKEGGIQRIDLLDIIFTARVKKYFVVLRPYYTSGGKIYSKTPK